MYNILKQYRFSYKNSCCIFIIIIYIYFKYYTKLYCFIYACDFMTYGLSIFKTFNIDIIMLIEFYKYYYDCRT